MTFIKNEEKNYQKHCETCSCTVSMSHTHETSTSKPADLVLQPWQQWCEKCQAIEALQDKHCPKCDAAPQFQEVRNYSMMWHDGDVHCTLCNTYVRGWDAG